jgi:hypothetical protein
LFGNLQNILEQQYVLAKKCGISITESNMMANFEMEIYVQMLMNDIQREQDALDGKENK